MGDCTVLVPTGVAPMPMPPPSPPATTQPFPSPPLAMRFAASLLCLELCDLPSQSDQLRAILGWAGEWSEREMGVVMGMWIEVEVGGRVA